MATKWKNKIAVLAWVLLFTFGLGGIFSALSYGHQYFQRDYFQTGQFEGELNQFIYYLNKFELNYIPKEEAKEQIVVTKDEVSEHRYRYGDLEVQIQDIQYQYEDKINEAQRVKNSELADFYITERDQKLEDITNNFKSDEHVKAKIIKEKEEKIDEYYQEIEHQRAEFTRMTAVFKYYLKDTATGEVYTNLTATNATAVDKLLKDNNTLFLRSYSTPKYGYLTTENPLAMNREIFAGQTERGARTFTGEIAVPKSAPASSTIMAEYHDFQQKQRIYFVYTISCVMAFLLSLYLYRKTPISQLTTTEKWQSHYQRFPIDVRLFSFLLVGLFTLMLLTNSFTPYSYYGNLYFFIRRNIFELIFTACFVTLTFMQGKLLWPEVKDWSSLKAAWQGGLIPRAYRGLKDAFLIRSIGFQVLFLLAVVFAFGAGIIIVALEPMTILIYGALFAIIGIPLLVLILRHAGRFNRIVINTTELAQGNMGADLPVEGKSALAVLAGNINKLKHGVKESMREQAKSERLKTELITNVSHDLRTPLTSIISYTELLKTPDLAAEDREAYIQIIDRKSKRLKVLIDDLFEASKMVSGNVELVKEKVDIGQLLQQALAEYDEAIGESTLQFRITNPDKTVYAVVDGQKMWRVFDNLIGNILKYALENTRVYISVQLLQGKVIITFKNIAKYELGHDGDELFERFKRGDTSRHTEGSGLGLAIAKSIVDLHGGSLDIDLDGDLFKVTITLN